MKTETKLLIHALLLLVTLTGYITGLVMYLIYNESIYNTIALISIGLVVLILMRLGLMQEKVTNEIIELYDESLKFYKDEINKLKNNL